MPPTTSPQFDTPPGTGGQINNNTGAVLSGPLAGGQAGTNGGPGGSTGAGFYTPPPSGNPPPVLNASTLGTSTAPLNVPPPTPTTSSPADPSSLTVDYNKAGSAVTGDQNTIEGLISKITGLEGTQGTQSAEQAKLEAAPGGVNDINSQINEINKQILALDNGAFAATQASGNRQAPSFVTNGEQAQIARQKAVQMYGLSAAASALNGDLSLAQQKVQSAIKAEFDPITAELNQYNTLLTQSRDNLTADQKEKADALAQLISDRQDQVKQQQQDKADVYALMIAAVKNNPGNPAAQAAMSKANALDVNDPEYKAKALALLGGFQSDPVAVKQAIASLNLTEAQTAKIYSDMAATSNNGSALAQTNIKTTTSGIQYVDGTNLTGADAHAAQLYAAQNNLPYLDKTAADLQNNVETARQNMSNISDTLEGLLPTSGLRVDQKLSNMFQSATQIGGSADALASFNAYRSAAIQALRAMAGAKGLRINQAEILQSVNQDIPKITDTVGVAKSKIAIVNSLLDSQEKGTFGSQFYQPTSGAAATTLMTGPDGKQYNVPNDKVDAFIKAGGKK